MRQHVSWILIPIFSVVLLHTGCDSQHQKNKEAALHRWQEARAHLTTDMARKQLEAGELKRAAITAQNIISNKPDYVPAYLVLGQVYLEQDRLSKARETFEQCLQLDPTQAQAYYFQGIIHEKWNQMDLAFEYYQNAWMQSRGSIPYLLAMVEIKALQGQYQQALTLLTENLSTVERDSTLYLTAGNLLASLNRHTEALDMFTEAHDISPDKTPVKEALAFAFYRVGRNKEALELFQTLAKGPGIDGNQNHWLYELAMGDCYMALKQNHQAQRCFETVTEQDPLNPKAWKRLAQVQLARDNLDQAEQSAQRALSLKPKDTEALMIQGYVALKRNNYSQGQTIFQRIVRQEENNGLAYCLLGQCLQADGKGSEAILCYSEALKINPEDTLAKRLMSEMQKTNELSYEDPVQEF
jgi:tetratricopeptide (TPR) repeat protein